MTELWMGTDEAGNESLFPSSVITLEDTTRICAEPGYPLYYENPYHEPADKYHWGL